MWSVVGESGGGSESIVGAIEIGQAVGNEGRRKDEDPSLSQRCLNLHLSGEW